MMESDPAEGGGVPGAFRNGVFDATRRAPVQGCHKHKPAPPIPAAAALVDAAGMGLVPEVREIAVQTTAPARPPFTAPKSAGPPQPPAANAVAHPQVAPQEVPVPRPAGRPPPAGRVRVPRDLTNFQVRFHVPVCSWAWVVCFLVACSGLFACRALYLGVTSPDVVVMRPHSFEVVDRSTVQVSWAVCSVRSTWLDLVKLTRQLVRAARPQRVVRCPSSDPVPVYAALDLAARWVVAAWSAHGIAIGGLCTWLVVSVWACVRLFRVRAAPYYSAWRFHAALGVEGDERVAHQLFADITLMDPRIVAATHVVGRGPARRKTEVYVSSELVHDLAPLAVQSAWRVVKKTGTTFSVDYRVRQEVITDLTAVATRINNINLRRDVLPVVAMASAICAFDLALQAALDTADFYTG